MTFLKKAALTPIAFAAVLASVQAVAAPINHTIQLEAFVPTSAFHVMPSDPSWIGNTQTLNYNTVTGELTSLTKQFDVKNIAGAISGKLHTAAILGSAGNTIPLTVKFNSITLDTTDKEVVGASQASTPSVVNLEIIPQRPVGGDYAPGTYTGNVQLSFDAIIP